MKRKVNDAGSEMNIEIDLDSDFDNWYYKKK